MRQLHLRYVTLVERELFMFSTGPRHRSFVYTKVALFGENREFRYNFTQFVREKNPE